MSEHYFTLILDGPVDERLDDLFEAGCDDASFGCIDRTHHAQFDRKAETFEAAVLSAITAVQGVGVHVVRVLDEDGTTVAEELLDDAAFKRQLEAAFVRHQRAMELLAPHDGGLPPAA